MFSPLPDGRIRLDEPLYCEVWKGSGVFFTVEVPTGFVCDGASIPSALWWLVGPPIRSNHLIPSIIHDWLCVQARTYPQRLLADAVFFSLLREYEVPRWKQTLMYLGVRFYGRFIWREIASDA